MNWQEVCEDKKLQQLPFKIELNKWGQIVMSQATVIHSFYQGRIQTLLESFLTTGIVMPELVIETRDGVKVADVVWVSDERADIILDETAASIAPEICIEVKSGSNTLDEMLEKKDWYFKVGAEEVWICDKKGDIYFYNHDSSIKYSLRVPDFPTQIKRNRNLQNGQ
ncbi:MAG TPA: Uma2 family endonuclease [Thioploca sp.]|nr:Uma2 family endonuclease [Thioploca sp.]